MVTVEVDVSEWFLVADWDARAESFGAMGERLAQTSAAIGSTFASFDGTWTCDDSTIKGDDQFAWSELMRASPYKVDGVAEPARGYALSLTSKLVGGVTLRVSVTAGAEYQTIINKPNEVALDFTGAQFGDALLVEMSTPPEERFRCLGVEIHDIWKASDLRVEFD